VSVSQRAVELEVKRGIAGRRRDARGRAADHQLGQRRAGAAEPADDFDNGHPVTDLSLARRKRRPAAAIAMRALKPSIPPTPRIDRELAANRELAAGIAAPPPQARPRAPAGRFLRVLPITLAILVAASAAYLLLHSGL